MLTNFTDFKKLDRILIKKFSPLVFRQLSESALFYSLGSKLTEAHRSAGQQYLCLQDFRNNLVLVKLYASDAFLSDYRGGAAGEPEQEVGVPGGQGDRLQVIV